MDQERVTVPVSSMAASGGTGSRATNNDVVRAFRLLLGREPTHLELCQHQERSVDALLEILAFSAEHKEQVLDPLNTGAPFSSDRFRSVPTAADASWLMTRTTDVAPTFGECASWRALLHRMRIHLQLTPPGAMPVCEIESDPSGAASREEVERAFRLVLGRSAEGDALQTYENWPADQLLVALLASNEFRDGVLPTILDGRLASQSQLVSIFTLSWLRRRFGLDFKAFSSRAQVLASLLGSQRLAEQLALASLAWSPVALVEILNAPLPDERDERTGQDQNLIDRLQRLSAGVEIERIQDMLLEGAGQVRFTSADPAIFFRLGEGLDQAAAVELTFTLGGARLRASGVLYLDYGEGFVEVGAIALGSRGRRVNHAIVIHPGRLRGLRWDPDQAQGVASVASISARSLETVELEQHLARLSGPEVASVGVTSRVEADAALSRLLTERAFGVTDGADYPDWIAANEPSPSKAQRIWAQELAALAGRPRIAVLTPLYNTPEPLLREMIESVLSQVYPEWELCLADDASTEPRVRAVVEEYLDQDPRIKAVFRQTNGHISEASNSALELVTADWVALLDHDDVLAPDALLAVAGEIDRHPEARFIYSDEDKLDDSGRRFDVFFKPDFSPELLRSQNYLNHLSVHRTEAIRAVGGWRKGFEGSQDYDLNLRTLERLEPGQVRHIPRVLYHWRAVAGSTALAVGEKSYAVQAGLTALSEHLRRMDWDATAGMVEGLPFYRVHYHVPDPAPLVSIVIPTRDRADLLATCIDSVLEKTDYPNYEILIADNGSVEPATFALFERLTADPRVRVLDAAGPFNYSRINNDAVRESAGELVCLLNNDIEVITPGWLTEMAGWALQPRIGCVGAKLYYPNDTIQHAGVILGIGGVAGHSHKHFPRDSSGYFSRLKLGHDISAVTGACLVVRRAIWDEVKGLEETLTVAFNDVDFCLRVRERGHRNVFTPFAEMYHHESPSRGAEDSPDKIARFRNEVSYMKERWNVELAKDPFYSKHLSLHYEDFSIAL